MKLKIKSHMTPEANSRVLVKPTPLGIRHHGLERPGQGNLGRAITPSDSEGSLMELTMGSSSVVATRMEDNDEMEGEKEAVLVTVR
jgi:hypothetical protein